MKRLVFIIFVLSVNIAFSQVQLLTTIGLNSQPQDTDLVSTIISRSQGNPWAPVNVGDTMTDFTLWDINGKLL